MVSGSYTETSSTRAYPHKDNEAARSCWDRCLVARFRDLLLRLNLKPRRQERGSVTPPGSY